MIVLSLVVSHALHVIVETPGRQFGKFVKKSSRRATITVLFGIATGMVLAGFAIFGRRDRNHDQEETKAVWELEQSLERDFGSWPNRTSDLSPDASNRMVLFGDSHAEHLIFLFKNLSQKLETNLALVFEGECPPISYAIPGAMALRGPYCVSKYGGSDPDHLKKIGSMAPARVIMSARWEIYIRSGQESVFIESLISAIRFLQGRGHTVLVVGAHPTLLSLPGRA
jgi:SGNH domain (fused to AT3 domains)